MNFIHLREGFSYALNPVFDLIEQKTELIAGCILVTPGSPTWFIECFGDDAAQKLLERTIQDRCVTHPLDAFIIAKEPKTYFQFTIFAAVSCCNLNYSGTGGHYGETLLTLLAKHNIRTHPAEIAYPNYEKAKTWHEHKIMVEECFWESFDPVSYRWFPEIWKLNPGNY